MSKDFKFNEQKLKKALETFRKYSQEDRFQEDIQEREERKRFFQKVTREKFNEFNFSGIIKKLWAAQIWRNQDYLVNKIIKDNGIDNLATEFSLLVSAKGTLGERYERFLQNIKGLGPAMVTEILCHTDPQHAGIWNDRARKSLAWLETKEVPYDKYKISGKEYDLFNNALVELAGLLVRENYQDVDLLFVNYFLWEVWDKFAKFQKEKEITVPRRGVSKHDEIRDKIAEIGSWLGFESETEKLVAPGAKVDVIWRARIANLGAVSYIFEVQDRGSVDALILNLQRAQMNPTVQKLIIVSDGEQISRIQKEISTMPENFRKATTFWDISDVENTHQNLEQVTSSITKLHLVED